MSNKKWTPGPWFANDSHPQHACYYIGPKDYAPLEVAIVYSPGQGKADADAHLIAASPDLYEALTNTIQFAEACHRQCSDELMRHAIGADIAKAHAALSKARGES